jgi:hypothetical protein
MSRRGDKIFITGDKVEIEIKDIVISQSQYLKGFVVLFNIY